MSVTNERPHEWKVGTLPLRLVPAEILGRDPHTEDPIPFLAQQISSTAELTYTDIDRAREVAFAQDDLIDGIASGLRFNLDNQRRFRYSKGVDTSYPGFMFSGPKVTTIGAVIANKPTKAVQRGSITYVAAGAELWQITNDTTRTLDTTFGSTITDLLVWGGFLVVALGNGAAIQYRASDTSGGAFSTSTGNNAKLLASVGEILWRANLSSTETHKIASADVITGTWATYEVGDSSYPVTGIVALDGGVLLVYKEDGAYAFDDQKTAIELTPELKLQADAQVGKAHAVHNRDAFFSSRRGIVQIEAGAGLRSIGFDTLADPALPGTPKETRPAAMCSDGRFLYAIVVSGNGVYIWKRDRKGAWHNYLYRSDLGAAADLLLATGKLGSTSVNAILFAYASGGSWQLAYARFPSTYDPTADSDYRFDNDTAQKVRTLDFVAAYPTIKKLADRLKVIADDLSSTQKVTAYLYIDDEAAITVGDFQKSPDDLQVLRKPRELHRVSVELETRSSSATTTAAIRAFHLTCRLQPPTVTRHTCHFLLSSETPLATGGRALGAPSEALARLRELRDERTTVKMVDEDGREFLGYVDEMRKRALWKRAGTGGQYAGDMAIVTINEVA